MEAEERERGHREEEADEKDARGEGVGRESCVKGTGKKEEEAERTKAEVDAEAEAVRERKAEEDEEAEAEGKKAEGDAEATAGRKREAGKEEMDARAAERKRKGEEKGRRKKEEEGERKKAEVEAEGRWKHIARCPDNQVLREPPRRNSISDPAPYLTFEDAGRTCEI